MDPKDVDGKSKWAPGEMADGSISVMTPEQALKAIGERDADEQAFDELIDGGDSELRKAYEAVGDVPNLEEDA